MKNKNLTLIILFIISISGYSQDFEKEFDLLLSKEYPTSGPGATALVGVNGKVIYQKAFGKANLELSVDMTVNSVLEIGSITKQFTAVSILMLVDQGKLKLDDEITKYIKDYPTEGHKITIHHLLSHTSGIGSFTALDEWYDNRKKEYTKEEFIDLFKKSPMLYAPGEKYHYSNTGYFLLSAVIEKISNKTYAEFIETYIFKPLEMRNTYYENRSRIILNRASGYDNIKDRTDGDFNESETVNGEMISYSHFNGAGGILSTVNDLFLWNRAIRNNKLISEESKRKAFTNHQLINGNNTNYGYGWVIEEINSTSSLEHNGGTFGFRSNSIYLPKDDVFVVVLSNRTYSNPDYVSTKMAAIAINKPYKEIHNSTPNIESELLQKIVGTYEFDDGSIRIISQENNELYSQRPNGNKIKIYSIETNRFYFLNSFSNLTFNLNKNKQPSVMYENRIYKSKGVKVK
ncbi:beta-lactamase family protein [Antarcticibacterium flavum]|uniref:Beta-lactamase family protein n=1 Tax=Antarcticibacterium flavum TaxID=2058175 RepID=A0A5B7X905_9FLAO|nr:MULTISPECIES: serine hydrolase domain-containing protein [Antarcticibacterium]MCM4161779.1 serine hydrolase [Antarcticibacterium sp. W02-3]QCY71143.1 beta-lactamase family protein [Antarcticibacterium flavum]